MMNHISVAISGGVISAAHQLMLDAVTLVQNAQERPYHMIVPLSISAALTHREMDAADHSISLVKAQIHLKFTASLIIRGRMGLKLGLRRLQMKLISSKQQMMRQINLSPLKKVKESIITIREEGMKIFKGIDLATRLRNLSLSIKRLSELQPLLLDSLLSTDTFSMSRKLLLARKNRNALLVLATKLNPKLPLMASLKLLPSLFKPKHLSLMFSNINTLFGIPLNNRTTYRKSLLL